MSRSLPGGADWRKVDWEDVKVTIKSFPKDLEASEYLNLVLNGNFFVTKVTNLLKKLTFKLLPSFNNFNGFFLSINIAIKNARIDSIISGTKISSSK